MMGNSNPVQRERVIEYMRTHGGITQFEALEYLGILRLASRISEIKKNGYPVKSRMVMVKNRYDEKCHVKRYWLEEEDDEQAAAEKTGKA